MQNIRLFVSSTFSDFRVERDTLHRFVFPKIHAYCGERGVSFQSIDLRWGIGTQAGLTNDTLEICVAEVERCRAESAGVFMLALLGHRYGWCPPPRTLNSAEFERLHASATEASAAELVDAWYQQDRNWLDTTFVLKPRYDRFLDHDVWRDEVEGPLTELFHRSRIDLVSATERELHAAFAGPLEDEKHPRVIAMLRSPASSTANGFFDALPDGGLDARKHASMCRLRDAVARRLGTHAHAYDGMWDGRDGGDGERSGFGALVETVLLQSIEQTLPGARASVSMEFSPPRCEAPVGQDRFFARLTEATSGCYLVHGPTGSGKTYLARAVVEARSAKQENKLLHWPGNDVSAEGHRSLLLQWTQQLGHDTAAAAELSYWSLCEAFRERLAEMAAGQSVLIVLDGADQLAGGQVTDWLPPAGLPGLLVIATCRSDSQLVADTERHRYFAPIELTPWTTADGHRQLEVWLRGAQRTLQPHQVSAVLASWQRAGGWPIQLLLAFGEISRWHSEMPPVEPLTDLHQCLPHLLRRLVTLRHHCELLTRRALTLLAASRHGLSDADLVQLLSADEVLEALRVHSGGDHAMGQQVVPDFVWTRLLQDLDPLLHWSTAGGERLVRLLAPALSDAILSGLHEEDLREIHACLARHFALAASGRQATEQRFRACFELPFHLAKAQQWLELDRHLCDIRFLMRALAFRRTEDRWSGMAGLLGHLDRALGLEAELPAPVRRRLQALADALRSEAAVLAEEPRLLPQQLHNRLVERCGRDDDVARIIEHCKAHLAEEPWFCREQTTSIAGADWRHLASDAYCELPVLSADRQSLLVASMEDRDGYAIECWSVDGSSLLRRFSLRTVAFTLKEAGAVSQDALRPIGLHLARGDRAVVVVLACGAVVVLDAQSFLQMASATADGPVVSSAVSPCGSFLLLVGTLSAGLFAVESLRDGPLHRFSVPPTQGVGVRLTHGVVGPKAKQVFLAGVGTDLTSALFWFETPFSRSEEVLRGALQSHVGELRGPVVASNRLPELKAIAACWPRGLIAIGDMTGSIVIYNAEANAIATYIPGRCQLPLLRMERAPFMARDARAIACAENGHWKPIVSMSIDEAGILWSVGTIGSSHLDPGRSGSSEIRVWDTQTLQLLGSTETDQRVLDICSIDAGRHVSSAVCAGNGLRVLRVKSRVDEQTPGAGLQTSWGRVAIEMERQLLANVQDLEIGLWDVKTLQQVQILPDAHFARVTALAWHPAKRLLASGASDGSIALWSGCPAERTFGAKFRGSRINALLHRPAQGDLIVAGTKGLLACVDVQRNQSFTLEVPSEAGDPLSLEAGIDGSVYAGCSSGTILMYSASGSYRGSLAGHSSDITGLTWGAAHKLISCSSDRSVRSWDTEMEVTGFRRVLPMAATMAVAAADSDLLVLVVDALGCFLVGADGAELGRLPISYAIAGCWYEPAAGVLQVLPAEGAMVNYSQVFVHH